MPAHSAAIPEWMATTCYNVLDSMNTLESAWEARREIIKKICKRGKETFADHLEKRQDLWGSTDIMDKVRIAGTLNSQRYISEVLEPVVLPYVQVLATAIFQQDNTGPHVTRIDQRFFVNHQIELLPWPARSPDLSPIENM
ncbi:transposable element Tcb1 transposase [Trichonephila clavipes]|nr:transposable element Tcb1 transposase [Trichonephila clavipes]